MNSQMNNNPLLDQLNKRFHDLWQRCLPANSSFAAECIYQDLLRLYSHTARYYHNLDHLQHCLKQLDLAADIIPHADAVEMALWFHDAVYTPGSAHNEHKSADLFLGNASTCFSDDFNTKVNHLILATTHKEPPQNEDECFVVDIDLSSFGLDWGSFIIDTENLRMEQADLSDQAYLQVHIRFLKSLLARKRIFYTEFFYRRYEQIAIQNITRLLDKPSYQRYT